MKDSGDEGSVDRLLTYRATEEDKEKATQAVIHYYTWHRTHLISALSWSQWSYYWTWHKAERMLAFVGLLGSGYTLARFAKGIPPNY